MKVGDKIRVRIFADDPVRELTVCDFNDKFVLLSPTAVPSSPSITVEMYRDVRWQDHSVWASRAEIETQVPE